MDSAYPAVQEGSQLDIPAKQVEGAQEIKQSHVANEAERGLGLGCEGDGGREPQLDRLKIGLAVAGPCVYLRQKLQSPRLPNLAPSHP